MTHLADTQPRWILNDKILSNTVGKSLVLLDLNCGFYYGLSDVSLEIWQMLKHPTSAIEVTNYLLSTYKIDRAQAVSDTNDFLDELSKMKLIKEYWD